MSNPAFKFDHVHIISKNPEASASWYVEMFGATTAANTMARGAPQIFVELGGMTILIRGQRPGEDPVAARSLRQYADFPAIMHGEPTISVSCTMAIPKRSVPSCAARA